MIFGIVIFDPYNVLLAIAKNIPQRLTTAFVLQRHILAFRTVTMYKGLNHNLVQSVSKRYICIGIDGSMKKL